MEPQIAIANVNPSRPQGATTRLPKLLTNLTGFGAISSSLSEIRDLTTKATGVKQRPYRQKTRRTAGSFFLIFGWSG
jgi:hypothetical protein